MYTYIYSLSSNSISVSHISSTTLASYHHIDCPMTGYDRHVIIVVFSAFSHR